jgi:hypothetical protein
MAEEYIENSGERAAESLTSYALSSRNSGSNQVYACIDMAAHRDDRKTLKKEEIEEIIRNCRDNVNAAEFTKFTYGLAYSPEFVKQVMEALKYRAEQLAEEEEDLARARRAVELGEKSVKESREKLEKMRQEAKAAGLKEVF